MIICKIRDDECHISVGGNVVTLATDTGFLIKEIYDHITDEASRTAYRRAITNLVNNEDFWGMKTIAEEAGREGVTFQGVTLDTSIPGAAEIAKRMEEARWQQEMGKEEQEEDE